MACPRTLLCDPPLTSFDIGRTPSYISLVSSSLSCLGSLLILLAYATLKDMRTGAQTIVTLLALADFFTAFGYIIGGVNFLHHFDVESNTRCEIFEDMCTIQSFITTWSTMASYSWTCILAFYFFLVIVRGRAQLASRLIPVYNIIAWVGPLTIMLPLLVKDKLGYAPYVASNWCYIKDSASGKRLKDSGLTILLIFVAGKLWEVFTYVFIMVIYITIKVHMRKTQKSMEQLDLKLCVPRVAQVEKRLLAIPLLYILLRFWGTLQFFYSLAVSGQNHNGCIPMGVRDGFLLLGILQAIGDGGQGWCNAILYIFVSKTMRNRLLAKPCASCIHVTLEKLDQILETESRMTRSERSRRHRGHRDSPETQPIAGDNACYLSTGDSNGGVSSAPKVDRKTMEVSMEQKSSGKV